MRHLGEMLLKKLTELLTLMRFFPGTTGGKMCFRIRLNARPEGILYQACINPLGSPDCPNAVIASQVSTCPVILIDHQMIDRSDILAVTVINRGAVHLF